MQEIFGATTSSNIFMLGVVTGVLIMYCVALVLIYLMDMDHED